MRELPDLGRRAKAWDGYKDKTGQKWKQGRSDGEISFLLMKHPGEAREMGNWGCCRSQYKFGPKEGQGLEPDYVAHQNQLWLKLSGSSALAVGFNPTPRCPETHTHPELLLGSSG